MIRKLKLLGQSLLVQTCREEANLFLARAKSGIEGSPCIRVDECIHYAKTYTIIARELEKSIDNLDRMVPSFIREVYDACVEHDLILQEEDDLKWSIQSQTVEPKLRLISYV